MIERQPPQTPEAAWKQCLRLVGREVELKERARHLELIPAADAQAEAERLFTLAFLLRQQRLELLVRAGLLESVERWTR